MSSINESAARNIESGLARGALRKAIVAYRGLTGEYSDLIRKFLLNGCDAIEPRTFQSVFTQQAIAHDLASCTEEPPVVLKINVPAGTPAIVLGQLPDGLAIHEHEIILPRNVVFMVNSLYKSGGKLYADVSAESAATTSLHNDPPPPKRSPKKVFTRDEAIANPVKLDCLPSDARLEPGVQPVGREPIQGYIQIGPKHYIRAYPGPIVERRFTKSEIFAKSLTIGQFVSQGKVYSTGDEAELGFLMLYKRDADGYYVMVYPEAEIEPGDFESPASWA